MGRWPRRVLVVVLVVALVGGVVPGGMTGLAQWLVVVDPLTHARAIVVLGGHLPFRAMEAAALYQQGWAPDVWLTRSSSPAEAAALAQLAIQVLGEETYNRQVLERLGVPTEAIHVLRDGAQNTVEEVQVVARQLQQVGGGRIILVTSKPHSRRVRATWHALVGDAPPAVVRFAADDPYECKLAGVAELELWDFSEGTAIPSTRYQGFI
jgi:uncharacterized SAM-binding protein YcdF (DUF218 family)